MNGWRLMCGMVREQCRLELEGPYDEEQAGARHLGCQRERVGPMMRLFTPNAEVAERVIQRRPAAA